MRNSALKISVVVATYNRPEALRLVLLSLNEQTDKNFEVIVGDDGSREDTSNLLTTLVPQVKYPLKHVWQEDDGFRLAMIRNRAVAQTSGEYIIFLDDDCPAPPWFIAKHRALAEAKHYVVGNRILLSETYTAQVLQQQLPVWEYSRWKWLRNAIKSKCNRFAPVLNLPLGPLRKLHPHKWRGLRGCNLALWKQDLININGFNEAFVGWGYEDSDFIIRLMRTGVKRKEGRFAVPVFHLWHRENDRSNERKNYQALQDILDSNVIKTEQGVSQYL